MRLLVEVALKTGIPRRVRHFNFKMGKLVVLCMNIGRESQSHFNFWFGQIAGKWSDVHGELHFLGHG